MLTAIGAVEPGTDLAQTQLDALDAGVAGYYDPETEELVIGSEEMDGLGAYITAHELVHAATDAAHGLPDTVEVEESAGSDAAYAALNVVEGDASLYSQRFVAEHLPMSELLGLQSESDVSTQAMADMPHYVSRSLQFPYMEGMAFSCDIYTEGGWDAVNQTYENLPTTSAQILFPDRYRDGEQAVDVTDPSGPSGWENVTRDTFGAADLLFLLEAPGGNTDAALSDPLERVSAWAGGEVGVWSRGEETAMELVLADRGTATGLCETVTDYYAAAFPDASTADDGSGTTFEGANQSATVTCADDEVTLSTRTSGYRRPRLAWLSRYCRYSPSVGSAMRDDGRHHLVVAHVRRFVAVEQPVGHLGHDRGSPALGCGEHRMRRARGRPPCGGFGHDVHRRVRLLPEPVAHDLQRPRRLRP